MKPAVLTILIFLLQHSVSAQLLVPDSLANSIKGPDTLYFPLRNGEQLIAVDYVNYYEQLAHRLDGPGSSSMSVPPSAHAPRAVGNTYFFRDTAGRITRVFNSSLSFAEVNQFNFRQPGYATPHIVHNRAFQSKLYNGNTRQMHRQQLPGGLYRVFNSPTKTATNLDARGLSFGLIDSLGNQVLPMDYVNVFLLDNKFFVYKENLGWGILNRQLDTIVPIAYREFMPKYNEQDELLFILFKKTIPQGYELLYNVQTQETYELDSYQNMYYISAHNAFVLHKSRAYGMMDAEGNVTIPVKYAGWKVVGENKIVFSSGSEVLEVVPK